jgi:hypothetical protein
MSDVSGHISSSVTFFRKSCCVCDNEEKFYKDGEATDDNVTRRTHVACWILKATNIHSQYMWFVQKVSGLEL